MKVLVFLVVLCLCVAPSLALVTVSQTSYNATNFEQARQDAIAAEVARQGELTRQYMTDFGKNTQAQYDKDKAAALDEIRREMRIAKFTIAIVLFAAVSAAILFADFVGYRLKRRYQLNLEKDELNYERARGVRDRATPTPEPHPVVKEVPKEPEPPLPPPIPSDAELRKLYAEGKLSSPVPRAPTPITHAPVSSRRGAAGMIVTVLLVLLVVGLLVGAAVLWLHSRGFYIFSGAA